MSPTVFATPRARLLGSHPLHLARTDGHQTAPSPHPKRPIGIDAVGDADRVADSHLAPGRRVSGAPPLQRLGRIALQRRDLLPDRLVQTARELCEVQLLRHMLTEARDRWPQVGWEVLWLSVYVNAHAHDHAIEAAGADDTLAQNARYFPGTREYVVRPLQGELGVDRRVAYRRYRDPCRERSQQHGALVLRPYERDAYRYTPSWRTDPSPASPTPSAALITGPDRDAVGTSSIDFRSNEVIRRLCVINTRQKRIHRTPRSGGTDGSSSSNSPTNRKASPSNCAGVA
jgi:hypothetical protein